MKNNQQAVTNTQLEHPQMAVPQEIRCQPISILSKAVTKMVRSHPTPFSTKLAETNTHGVDVDFAFMTDGLARLSMVQKMGYPNPEHPPKQDYVKRLLDIAFGYLTLINSFSSWRSTISVRRSHKVTSRFNTPPRLARVGLVLSVIRQPVKGLAITLGQW